MVTSPCRPGCAGVPAGRPDVEHAIGEDGLDRHAVRAVIVADGDQIGEREVGQRVGQLVEIHLDAHTARIVRRGARRPCDFVRNPPLRPYRFAHSWCGGPVDDCAAGLRIVGCSCDRAAVETIEWPFRAAEALESEALTFRELRRFHAAIYPGVWAPRGADPSVAESARAAWLWSGRQGVIAGLPASALLGAKWVEDGTPIELVHANRRPPRGIVIHTDALGPGETEVIDSMPVTTAARTAFDLGRRLPLKDGVQRIDVLMNATHVKVDAIESVMACHRGVRGLTQMRRTLALVDGGADRPRIVDATSLGAERFPGSANSDRRVRRTRMVFARIDMGWPEYRVGVDFEGAHHWSDPKQRSWDIERFAKLPDLGWIDVRLTSGILHNRPQSFLDRVGAALISRGCPKTW